MRVISGSAGGHRLKTLKSNITRPTADRVKESLFNIIADIIYEADVLDLFAGSGALGIEALSRGAGSSVFVDNNPDAVQVVKQNLEHTRLVNKAVVMVKNVFSALSIMSNQNKRFDIVFMDPPYNKGLIGPVLADMDKYRLLKEKGIVAVERSIKDEIIYKTGEIALYREQKYGDTVLAFYSYNN